MLTPRIGATFVLRAQMVSWLISSPGAAVHECNGCQSLVPRKMERSGYQLPELEKGSYRVPAIRPPARALTERANHQGEGAWE